MVAASTDSLGVFVQAWNTFVHYANFHFPPEPNGFYGYNALQQLAYFATIFFMAPLSILTGLAMSPALANRFPAYIGIAQWGGVSLRRLIEHVRPLPYAKTIAFYSFGGSLYGGAYYDTQDIYNALKPECMLAFDMNGERLPELYGAPLRPRVENQLGYKMVKWIERIEFVESEKQVGEGEGGKNEDDEYFDLLPNI